MFMIIEKKYKIKEFSVDFYFCDFVVDVFRIYDFRQEVTFYRVFYKFFRLAGFFGRMSYKFQVVRVVFLGVYFVIVCYCYLLINCMVYKGRI